MISKKIRKILKVLPPQPGVYRFLDQLGKILYIGKAKNLKSRVKSYWQTNQQLSPAKILMLKQITKIQYTIVSNETEAILLESSLIKKYQPPYNIDLKDDKYFLYIKITNEPFPKIITTRKIINDRAVYFGPYTQAKNVKQILRLIRKIFLYRTCNRDLKKLPDGRVCLLYHLNQCLGPCELKCTKAEYLQTIKRLIKFLKGQTSEIIRELKQEMFRAAEQKNFEQAAIIRDQIQAIENLKIKQKVVFTNNENQDVFSLIKEKNLAVINLFKIREGKLIDQQIFTIKNVKLLSANDILKDFFEKYYAQTQDQPKEIVVNEEIKNLELPIKKITLAKIGKKAELIKLGLQNANDYLIKLLPAWLRQRSEKNLNKLKNLQKILNLPRLPKRIEGYDISNIQGQLSVGSLVVLTNGEIDKSQYRRFKIKTIKGANDPAMIGEIIKRRLNNNWPKPDLILIDGGLSQLNAALKSIGKVKIPVISLAKREELIFKPNEKLPIKLARPSPTLQLLQRLRDEAHRFAISYHRKLRKKKLIG